MQDAVEQVRLSADDFERLADRGYYSGLAVVGELESARDVVSAWTFITLLENVGAGHPMPSVVVPNFAATCVDVLADFGVDDEHPDSDDAFAWFSAGYDEGVLTAVGAPV